MSSAGHVEDGGGVVGVGLEDGTGVQGGKAAVVIEGDPHAAHFRWCAPDARGIMSLKGRGEQGRGLGGAVTT